MRFVTIKHKAQVGQWCVGPYAGISDKKACYNAELITIISFLAVAIIIMNTHCTNAHTEGHTESPKLLATEHNV